jgi:UDP-glucose 4-epimerase
MKILITGNSGYIGSHLSTLLLNLKYFELSGLDKNKLKVPLDKFYYQNIQEDLVNIKEIYDCVIHLAAEVSVGQSVSDPILYYQTNTFGTLNVLKNIKTKHFIFASTGAATNLNSPYGISKKAAEEMIDQHCRKNNIPFTIFRFYNVIGTEVVKPTNPDGLMWNLINAQKTETFNLLGNDYHTNDGSAVRDYVHVNEICHALATAIDNPTYQIENLGHGTGTSVKQMIDLYKKVNSCEFEVKICPRRSGDLEFSVLDNPSKFMKKFYSIEELLKVQNGKF